MTERPREVEELIAKEARENLREWVATIIDSFVAPLGVEASSEAIDTLAQVVECRAREIALRALELGRAQAPASPQDRECVHGHTQRQVGCVSCVLVFDYQSASPEPVTKMATPRNPKSGVCVAAEHVRCVWDLCECECHLPAQPTSPPGERPFQTLRERMSPEAQQRAAKRTADILAGESHDQQDECARLRTEIAEAREACPAVRMQDNFDAPLLALVNLEVSRGFMLDSHCARLAADKASLVDALKGLRRCIREVGSQDADEWWIVAVEKADALIWRAEHRS